MSFLTIAAVFVGLAGLPQAAPSAEEQRLFAEGLRAYESGDARAAERAWKAGYAVAHDPAFLVRIGEAEEKAGAPAEAAESYRRYLREAPDAADRADIEQRLSALAPATAPAAPDAAPDQPESPPEPGGAARALTPPPPAAAPAVDAESARRRNARQDDQDEGWNRYRITAWVSTAATVALLGTAGFFAASAASNQDDVDRLITFSDPMTGAPLQYSSVAQRYRTAVENGQRDDRIAKGLLIGAAVAAAVATTAFILDQTRHPDEGLALGPAPADRGGMGLVGSWTWSY
jgi:hypothetical protein